MSRKRVREHKIDDNDTNDVDRVPTEAELTNSGPVLVEEDEKSGLMWKYENIIDLIYILHII